MAPRLYVSPWRPTVTWSRDPWRRGTRWRHRWSMNNTPFRAPLKYTKDTGTSPTRTLRESQDSPLVAVKQRTAKEIATQDHDEKPLCLLRSPDVVATDLWLVVSICDEQNRKQILSAWRATLDSGRYQPYASLREKWWFIKACSDLLKVRASWWFFTEIILNGNESTPRFKGEKNILICFSFLQI